MEPRRATVPRPVVGVAVLAGVLITVLALRELAWLVTPAMLAVVIVALVHPVHAGLTRRGVPGWIALVVLLLAVYGVLLVLVAVVVYALARLATILPDYVTAASGATSELGQQLAALGIGSDQVRELTASVDLLALAGWLTGQVPSLLALTTGLILVYSLLLFIGIESAQVGRRARALTEDHPRLARSLVGFVANTRRYVAVTGLFAVAVGGLDAIFLAALGVPLALVWGLLAAACNFIPYVGFIIGMVPPALLALLDQGWETMVVVIIVYILLNSVITTILPAKFVGNAVGMSMTVTMASVAFWSWVLGPLGAVLAIPMSLLVKAVFIDHVPSARWLAGFVNAAPRPEAQSK